MREIADASELSGFISIRSDNHAKTATTHAGSYHLAYRIEDQYRGNKVLGKLAAAEHVRACCLIG